VVFCGIFLERQETRMGRIDAFID